MAERSRYDILRRRLAPIAVLIALGVLAYELWGRSDRTSTTIVLDLGGAAQDVRNIRADVFVGDEPVAWFETALTTGVRDISFPAVIDGPARVRVQVTTAAGIRVLERSIRPDSGDTITLHLGDELRS